MGTAIARCPSVSQVERLYVLVLVRNPNHVLCAVGVRAADQSPMIAPTRLDSLRVESPSTAADPQRVVSFINVVGCGTAPSSGMRQNRRQVIESATSRHSDS